MDDEAYSAARKFNEEAMKGAVQMQEPQPDSDQEFWTIRQRAFVPLPYSLKGKIMSIDDQIIAAIKKM